MAMMAMTTSNSIRVNPFRRHARPNGFMSNLPSTDAAGRAELVFPSSWKEKPALAPARCPGSLLRQLLAVHRLDALLAYRGDHVAEARGQIARPQTTDHQVALLIERGRQPQLAAPRRADDDNLLGEIDFRDLVRELPRLPELLQPLGAGDAGGGGLLLAFILHGAGPLLEWLHGFLLGQRVRGEQDHRCHRHQTNQPTQSRHHEKLLW